MRNPLWLHLSLVLNGVLLLGLLAVFARGGGRDKGPESPREAKAVPVRGEIPPAVEGRAAPVPTDAPEKPAEAPAKTVVNSGPLETVIKNLRAAGIPGDDIAVFVNALLDRKMAEERRELQKKAFKGEIDPSTMHQMHAEQESAREQALRSLLGEEAFLRWDKENVLRRWTVLEGLSPEETNALYGFQKENSRQERELARTLQAGEIDHTDYMKRVEELQKKADQRMSEILDPRKLARLKQANDWGFGLLRWEMRTLGLTDAEVESLYLARQRMAEKQRELQQLGRSGALVDNTRWQTVQQEQDLAFEQVLGQTRYAAYKKIQDYSYKQLKQNAKAWQLSDADIEYVYQTIADQRQGIQDFYKQAAGKPADPQGIEAFKRQTEAQLRARLGDERLKKLQQAGLLPR